MKRIAILANSLDESGPVKGAVALYREIERMRGTGAVPSVSFLVVGTPPNPWPEEYECIRGRVDFLHCPRWRQLGIAMVRFARAVREARYSAVVSFGFRSNILNSFRSLGAARIAVVRATTIREPFDIDYADRRLFARSVALLAYMILGAKDAAVYLYREMIDADRRNYWAGEPGEFVAIPNFIEEQGTLERAGALVSLPGALASKGAGGERPFVFVAVAMLNRKKNVGELIEAVAQVAADRKNVRLVVVGDGEERRRLELLVVTSGIADIVEFMGFQENPMPIVASSDCFVLSSLTDATPRAAMEALFLGTPVIVPELPGLRHLVTPNNGIVYERGQLAEAMKLMMDQRQRYTPGLPPAFRQREAARRYIDLVHGIGSARTRFQLRRPSRDG